MDHLDINRRRLLQTIGAGAAAGAVPAAFAQSDWPKQAVKLIVPYTPGGVTDLTMRLVSKEVAERLGQPIIVENRPGAGGVVGTAAVAKAAPDGYTIGACASSSIIATPMLNAQVPFDVEADLALVSLTATVPMVLVVNSTVPVNSGAELLKYVRANRGKLNYGSTAVGHYGHVALMEISDSQDAGMVHSPYKGEAPLVQDVVSGQLQLAFFAPSTIKPMADAGKVRMLGVSGTRRLKMLPDLPTLVEQGFQAPVFGMNPGWVGIIAPSKTPKPVLQRLSAEYSAATLKPEVADQIADLGMSPVGSTADAFVATYQRERPVWKGLLTKAGLEVR
ncbi:MAG TPA: tripartite tricarboxylate transporter substrate binding protein [Burkholderiaceae bacterium]|mgnify:CR=1 FL=1|nr:tripartite tricarboxylate transporter substrate binding protein [Burkholderiaceae bacterium]